MKNRRFLKGHKRNLLLMSILVSFAAVAYGQVTPVATGLNNPRGLAFGPGGVLYIGEAGLGAGNGAGGVGLGVGFPGSVGEIRDLSSPHPTFTRIITRLASSAATGGRKVPGGVRPVGSRANTTLADASR